MSGIEPGVTRNPGLGKLFLSHDEIIKADPVDVITFLQQIGRLLANDSA